MKTELLELLQQFWDDTTLLAPNFVVGISLLLLIASFGYFLGKFVKKRYQKKEGGQLFAGFIGKIVFGFFFIIGLFAWLQVMGFGNFARSLLAGAGIGAVLIGFAFKDIAENFLAGFLIAFNRPFKAGDIIEIEGFRGKVKDIDLRSTQIRTVDGRDVFLPNSMILKSVLANYTRDGLQRFDFDIALETDADFEKAKELVLAAITADEEVLSKPKPDVLLYEFGEFCLTIKVIFWVDMFSDKRRDLLQFGFPLKSRIMLITRDALLKEGFNLPSPITELKMHQSAEPVEIHLNN